MMAPRRELSAGPVLRPHGPSRVNRLDQVHRAPLGRGVPSVGPKQFKQFRTRVLRMWCNRARSFLVDSKVR
jgi:hypothetical protein